MFKNIFKKKEAEVIPQEEVKQSKWKELRDEKPGHTVVIGALDTYDCGWVQETVWWNENQNCWMAAGSRNSRSTLLHYTHWRELTLDPDGN